MLPRVLLLAILLPPFGPPIIAAPHDTPLYAKLIVGEWEGPRRIRVFHANGTWGVKKFEDDTEEIDGRRWQIKGQELILVYRGDHGFLTSAYKILSFTPQKFVTEVGDFREEYVRLK